MKNKNIKKGITRRESLQLGASVIAGMALPFSGLGSGFPGKNKPDMPRESVGCANPGKLPGDWFRDIAVVSMPAAAVGGKQAGVYNAADNGVKPWNKSILRWLTSKSVRGNGAVLVRQEANGSGAKLEAIVDPYAEYDFEVSVHVPVGIFFGTPQEESLQVWVAVLGLDDNILVEKQVDLIKGEWSPTLLSFSSGSLREIRCVVYAKSITSFPCVYYVEGFQLVRKDYKWWNPQNYFNASRTVDRLTDRRAELIKAFTPDAVAGHNAVYLNWDKFFTDKNILVGGGNWEQEYNGLSVDDPILKDFGEDGYSRNADGSKIEGGRLWPSYMMCHSSPVYHDHFIKRITRIASEVQLFTQDNIGSPSFQGWGNGCYCKWCKQKFRAWLIENKDIPMVQDTGIVGHDSFDIAQYVTKVETTTIKKGSDLVIKDPILKSFIIFNYVSQSGFWRDSVKKLKEAAGHPIAVMGNHFGVNGQKTYSVVLSQISDLVYTENGIGAHGKIKLLDRVKAILSVKLGLAAGEFKRSVWLQYSSLFHSPVAAKSRLRFVSAQTLANGGLSSSWATTVGASGWFFDTEAMIGRFTQKYRHLFTRCDGYANVGLVYSLPTHLWRGYSSFGYSNKRYQDWFFSFANLLEDMHIPYEANCWWHPLLGSDEVSLERLSRYKLLILPGVESFTDRQLEALDTFRQNGGAIIYLSCPDVYNEYMEPLPTSKKLKADNKQIVEIRQDVMKDYKRFVSITELKVSQLLDQKEILKTDAPSYVWSSLRMDENGDVLSLHLVNGDINEEEDQFRSVERSNWEVSLPENFKVTKASLISPDIPENEKNIPIKVSNGCVKVTVPNIESYSIVSFYSGNALNQSEKRAKQKRYDMMEFLNRT